MHRDRSFDFGLSASCRAAGGLRLSALAQTSGAYDQSSPFQPEFLRKCMTTMRIQPETSGVGIVLQGQFTPAILTPAWSALHGLLPRRAADTANLQIAQPLISAFSTE